MDLVVFVVIESGLRSLHAVSVLFEYARQSTMCRVHLGVVEQTITLT